MDTELTTLNNNTVAKDAEQDDMRTALRAKTTEAQEFAKLTYKTSSTRLDAVMGFLGRYAACQTSRAFAKQSYQTIKEKNERKKRK